MELTPRFYLCALCFEQVLLCTRCDRGNIYCSRVCASIVRKKSLREAGIRYQDSLKGRLNHALRQRRYMQRVRACKNKMTHQGSCATARDGLLAPVKEEAMRTIKTQTSIPITCCLCRVAVSSLFRYRFLRYGAPKTRYSLLSFSKPP